jgi:hypothetical protein
MTSWPAFPVGDWAQTGPTLLRWMQIIGKVRLALTPPRNHFWHVPLYVSSRGLTTSAVPYGQELFELEFDFVEHVLWLTPSWTARTSIPLAGRSVAAFYADVKAALTAAGIHVRILGRPVEVADITPFADDHAHATYDPVTAQALWRALIQVDRVFSIFRGEFLGKSSPVHFFWGSFDLAVTRFSGRRGPGFTGPALNVHPHVMHESYSHEVSSVGFWPGDGSAAPIFYSYAVPEPNGFRTASDLPPGASYSSELGEYVLPYAAVQGAADPDAALLQFLRRTYVAAADHGGWDRQLLEERPACVCDPPRR